MTPEEYASAFQWDLLLDDMGRDRSVQTDQRQLGMSDIGGCREYVRRFSTEQPFTDSPERLPAMLGTWIDASVKKARVAARPSLIVDATVTLTLKSRIAPGIVLTGHPDEIDPNEPSVTDLKGLALTTRIPTPSGWTTMQALAVGDEVFGSDGKPCRVTAKSTIKNLPTYVVRFGDGSQVVCDEEHYWWVLDGNPPMMRGNPVVRGVGEIKQRLHCGQKQLTFRVPVAQPLDLPEVDLPIHPWALGAWLGDGSSAESAVTIGDGDYMDMAALWAAAGEPIRRLYMRSGAGGTYAVGGYHPLGLRTRLGSLNLLKNKHVPDPYLRASIAQRQEVVRGLMDTDGTWNKRRRRAVYCTTSKSLAEGMYELLVSLGEKPNVDWRTVTGFGVQTERCSIEWSPLHFVPFALARKVARVQVSALQRARATFRVITAVEEGPAVATACISVDSTNRTYLCGEGMIPTHNTKDADGLALVRREGSTQQQRYQRHLYYAACVEAGLLPPEGIVRNIYLDRSGKDPNPYVEQEPYDPAVVAEATDWLDSVLYGVQHEPREELTRDTPEPVCRRFCPFYSACRGSEWPGDLEENQLTAARLFLEADAEIKKWTPVKEAAKELLAGSSGTLDGITVRSTVVNGSETRKGYTKVEVRAA